MVSKLKIVIGVTVVAVCVTALVVGIYFGTKGSNSCDTAAAPTDLKFTQTGQSILVSWEDRERSEDCDVTYMLTYDLDTVATSTRNVTTLSYTVGVVEPCTVLSVHIWAIGDSGELSEDHLMQDYTVTPAEITPPTNVKAEVVDENLEITWETATELSKCESLTYQISIETDKEPISGVADNSNSYSIDYVDFCLKANVSIATVYDGTAGTPEIWSYEESGDILNIRILDRVEGSDEVTVTWSDHPKTEECGLTYTYSHQVGDENTSLSPGEGELQVNLLYQFCEEASIIIVIQGEDGTTIEITEDITQYPTTAEIGTLSGVDIQSDVAEKKRTLTWDEVSIGECAISYAIEFTTDLSADTQEFSTSEVTYEVPEDIYCYELAASVYAVINADSENSVAGVAANFETQGYEIFAVDDLVYSYASDVLTLTWNAHPKAELCSFEYNVAHTYDGVDEASVVSEPTATIDITLEYCVEALVSVTTINTDNPTWVSTAAEVTATQTPEDVGSVSNIAFDAESGEITWEAAAGTERCTGDIEYSIVITADGGSPSTESATEPTYTISAESYCFAFSIEITQIFGEIVGVPVESTFENPLESPTDLLLERTSDTTLTATWDAHSKLSQCGITYEVTYAYGTATATVEPNIVELPLAYCTTATVSVVAISSSGVRSTEATETHSEDDPESVGQVKNIGLTEGTDAAGGIITWEAPDYVSECTDILYAVIATDTNDMEIDRTDCLIRDVCTLTSPTDFCGATISVQATSITGVEATYTHTC